MPRALELTPRLVRLLASLAAVALLAPAAAGAGVPAARKSQGPLTPQLVQLKSEELRSKSPARQAEALGVAQQGPGSLVREDGRVLVSVRFSKGALASRDELRAAGGGLVSVSGTYQSATVAMPPARLGELAAIPTVASVSPVLEPIAFAVDCEGGSVISEGVAQLQAKTAREQFGTAGSGIEVGVLSDSYDGAINPPTDAGEDIETADLPGAANTCSGQTGPVDVIEELSSEPGEDEGRAMLQIVHDMAPKASLSFATAFESEESFAANIRNLATAGADVIVDDVAWFEEPFFQDGPVAVAVNDVTGEGVSYLSAAGNDNLLEVASGNEIASWEAPAFRDAGGCPEAIANLGGFNGSHCMDFNPGSGVDTTFGITVGGGQTLTLDLQWAEPWQGVDTDLDAFLLSSAGGVLTKSFRANSGATGTQKPLEIIQWKNLSGNPRTVSLAINRFSGGSPRLKFILLQNGGGVSAIEYPKSSGGDVVGPSIFGHAGAASAIAVAAVPFNNSNVVEPYSSRGPVAHYFGPVHGATAAPPLATPEILSKPDVAATDCGRTTFFASEFAPGVYRFCGTSAAAPYAAGALALMREAAPSADLDLLRRSLVGTAVPVGSFGPCAIGGGLVETVAAVKAAREEIVPSQPEVCPADEGAPPPDTSSGTTTPPTTPPPSNPPVAPATRILRHPPKLVRVAGAAARLTFGFGSDQADVAFLCKVDRSRYRRCPSRFVRRYRLGRHVVRVKARNGFGLTDQTAAVFRFRVERS